MHMAKNINSGLFSLDVFRHLWHKSKIFQVVLPRPKCFEKAWMPEIFVDSVVIITCYRRMFFQEYLTQIIRVSAETFSKSNIDFYLFFKENVVDFFPHKDMVVFDKIFMSFAFVIEMCYWCSYQGTNMFIEFAPNCWELYFDTEMLEQFDYEGGWEAFMLYVDIYSQSKIFSFNDVLITNLDELEFVNVKELFETVIKDYDIVELVECFKWKLENRENKGSKFCLQCLPLFTALSSVACADENFTLNNILIEGYIQLLVQLLSDEELKILTTSVKENLKYKRPDIFGTDITDYQTLSSLNAKENRVNEIKRMSIENFECKKSATKVLIENLFQEVYFKCDDCDCCCESIHMGNTYDTCMFCTKELFLILDPTEAGHLWREIELIKSTICTTIKTTVIDTEAQIKSAKLLKDRQISIEKNIRDEKDALRMFFVLGVQPGRTNMLKALKNEALKHATEDNSKLKLDESIKGNRKKAKNKKRIK